MDSLLGSRRSFRAFVVLAISVICFFAFQQLYEPTHGITHHHASVHKASYKNVAATLPVIAHQLSKRVAVSFGDAARNISCSQDEKPATHPDLVKRANVWSLDYDTAVCKGKKLRDRIDTSSGNGRIWQYSDLDRNGWTVSQPGENGREAAEYPDALKQAMTAYGVSTSLDQNQQRFANLDHPFVNDAGQEVVGSVVWYM